MATISAADVKKLRDATGAGMMDCKKALTETDGDFDKAVEVLRMKGAKDIGKRAERSAAEGLVVAAGGAMIELNSETDFVAKAGPFIEFSNKVLGAAVESGATDVQALLAYELDGKPVSEHVIEAGALLGEKVDVRRIARIEGQLVDAYLHKTSKDLPAQVGVLLAVEGSGDAAAQTTHDVAVHIAAYSPTYLTREDVPAELVESERRIADETARAEGKPEQALAKIVEGRLTGFFKEGVLVDQAFAKDAKKSVAAVLTEADAKATAFARFRVGA